MPLLAVFISLVSVFFSPSAVLAADSSSDYYCPKGYNYDSQYHLCSNGSRSLGPITPTMVQTCQEYGGGKACTASTLSNEVAKNLRGTTPCPPGATEQSGYCIEGEYAYGPFTNQQVQACIKNNGGSACQSMRMPKSIALQPTPGTGSSSTSASKSKSGQSKSGQKTSPTEPSSPPASKSQSGQSKSGQKTSATEPSSPPASNSKSGQKTSATEPSSPPASKSKSGQKTSATEPSSTSASKSNIKSG